MSFEIPQGYELIVFDLDGTLAGTKSGKPFHEDERDFALLPGRKEAIAALRGVGIALGVATNQGGIAFGFHGDDMTIRNRVDGYFTHPFMRGIQDFLHEELSFHPLDVRICPHHPGSRNLVLGFKCVCRKPNPYMLLDLMVQYDASADRTLMVGDREEDEGAALAAGCGFVWANDFFGNES